MQAARLVEVVRGGWVESVHFGAAAICDSSGALLASAGDPTLATHVRSAAKPFQSLPLLLAGGAERFELTEEEIAVTASSHLGEPFHVRAVLRLLAKGGFGPGDLHCGAHPPFHPQAARHLAEAGEEPTPLHNNCSGKHAGMLLACRLGGWDAAGYWCSDSPLQEQIRALMRHHLSLAEAEIRTGVDGCSLPSFHVPLRAMATAYARLLEDDAAAWPMSEAQRAARDRVTWAMRRRPEFVRGTGSLTTSLMRLFEGRLLGKEGAEAYYAIGLAPSESTRVRAALRLAPAAPRALGIALKVADGGDRGRDPVILELLDQIGLLPARLPDELAALRRPAVRNARMDVVGELRPCFRLEPAPEAGA